MAVGVAVGVGVGVGVEVVEVVEVELGQGSEAPVCWAVLDVCFWFCLLVDEDSGPGQGGRNLVGNNADTPARDWQQHARPSMVELRRCWWQRCEVRGARCEARGERSEARGAR